MTNQIYNTLIALSRDHLEAFKIQQKERIALEPLRRGENLSKNLFYREKDLSRRSLKA